MIFDASIRTSAQKLLRIIAGVLLACLVTLFAAVPKVYAAEVPACTVATDGVGNYVVFESCTETPLDGDNTAVTIAVPPNTVSGDLLIASISVDGNETVVIPTGWLQIQQINSNGDVTLAVFSRVADGTEGASYTFTWAGDQQVIGIMMRFTGATGNYVSVTNSGTAATVPESAIVNTIGNTTATNNMILHLVGWDDNDALRDPVTIIDLSGQQNINQDFSSGGKGDDGNMGAAAYFKQSFQGPSDQAFFEDPNEEWATVTIAIEPLPPSLVCTVAVDGTGLEVVFESCLEAKAVAVTSISPSVPNSASGDLLIAAIAVDGNETIVAALPAAWTPISQTVSNSAVTFAVFSRIVDGTEPATYAFTWGNSQGAIAYIMRFSGTSGNYVVSATNTGITGNPLALAVDTNGNATATDNMILRLGAWDGFAQAFDPATIIAGYSNINQDASTLAIGGVSSAAAYLNQAGAGSSGTAQFVSGTEEWVTQSIAIEPAPKAPSGALCPSILPIVFGSQLVVLEGCSEAKNGNDVNNIDLYTPASTAVWELLVAAINTDNDETITAPGGWTQINQGFHNKNGPTQALYYKFAVAGDVAGATSYNFATSGNEEQYAYMLNLSGASGIIIDTVNTDDSNAPIALSINTIVANTLVIRLFAADSNDITPDPAVIVVDQRNITYDYSSNDGDGVSAGAVYANEPAIGATGSIQFSLDNDEEWRAVTLGVEPIEFRFINLIDNSLSLCAIQEVEIRVVDSANNPITGFTGTVTLSTSGDAGGIGTWATGTTADQAQGTLDNNPGGAGTITDGIATYQFDVADNGTVILEFTSDSIGGGANTLSYDLSYTLGLRTFSENPSFDPTLILDNNCEFRIEHDELADNCGMEAITITLVDSAGLQAENYVGETVDITLDSGAGGDYVINTGNGTLDNGVADDGIASYTFDATDNAQVILDYTNIIAGTVNFDATDTTNNYLTDTDAPLLYDADLVIGACEIRITMVDAMDQGDVCSLSLITFTITDSVGTTITNFVGTVTISTDTFSGNWSGGGTNTVIDAIADDGEATYLYDVLDLGVVTVNLQYPFTNAALGFTASGTATNGAAVSESGVVNETLEVLGCTVDIQVTDNAAEICVAGEVVTYTILTRDGVTPADTFTGTLVLTNAQSNGDYVAIGENGTFDNGTGDDGIAVYIFDDLDDGVLVVEFTNQVAETVDLNASAPGITEDAGSDDSVTFNSCEFQISVADATTDVCSITTVTISLFESDGVTAVTGYTGTINLSTTTGNGTWAKTGTPTDAEGAFNDPVAEDGNAVYTFVGADVGTITLQFTDATNEIVNINVSDGISTDPLDNLDPFDPDIDVALCTIEISYTDGNPGISNACTVEIVQIRVVDRDSADALDYEGTINLSTSTNNGNWTVNTGDNAIVDTPNDDDGLATYTFGPNDDGIVLLNFEDLNPETVSLDAVDGVIVVDGGFDPDLSVQSCFPVASAAVCTNTGQTASIAITDQASNPLLQGRMVVMLIAHEGTTDVTSATFDVGGLNSPMTRLYQEKNSDGLGNTTEMWAVADAGIPVLAAGGPYTASFVGAANTPGMCLIYLTDVDQALPVFAPGTATDTDPVNGSQAQNTQDATTTITTPANNSMIVSLVSNGSTGTYTGVNPTPPLTRSFNGPNPNSAVFAGSTGVAPVAALVFVTETASANPPNRHSAIVASFGPIISGPPVPVDYEPVILFQTYAGNISYKAIGNTVRAFPNEDGVAAVCVFVPEATGSAATLVLPDDPFAAGSKDSFSSITAAWLYWAGSGDIDDDSSPDIQADVRFGPTGADLAISADDVFRITDATPSFPDLDFFLGYKDVTAVVAAEVAAGNGVTDPSFTFKFNTNPVQSNFALNAEFACVGGWALVVVFDNPLEELRVINLFQGFQPFRFSSFTLVPRNFRMATVDNTRNLPNGLITHISFEGDETGNVSPEGLRMQDGPGLNTFTELANIFNPSLREFNSTVTRPVFCYDATIGSFQWVNATQPAITCVGTPALNRDGFEIDFPGPEAPDPFDGAPDFTAPYDDEVYNTDGRIGNSFGVDIDTHYLQDELDPFGVAGFEAEEITTQYESDADLVLLAVEIISVTNFPIADIEVFKTDVGTFDVAGTGQYQITVVNNGNGASSLGFADGQIIVSDILPAGMTFLATTDVAGDGWDCGQAGGIGIVSLGVVEVTPGAFTCVFNIATEFTAGPPRNGDLVDAAFQLSVGEVLPTLTVNVQIGDSDDFPLLNNDAKNIARVIHVGYPNPAIPPTNALPDTSCPTPLIAGVSPPPFDVLDPSNTCARSPQFDNVNDLQGGTIDINDIDDGTVNQNNVDSITTTVKGVEADLSVDKFVNGVLEEGEDGQYTIRVTNNGPDTATGFTVSDTLPAEVTLSSLGDPEWDCTATVGNVISCTYTGAGLAPAASKDLLVDVTVVGSAGQNVTNTVSVVPGNFNFDTNSSNDADTDITAIVAPPVGSNEKFLFSVNTAAGLGGPTDIGGLSAFEDGDLVIYDPLLDSAVLFFDDSTLAGGGFIDVDDINAVHLLPNGHVVISVNATSTATGVGSFEPEDLIVYDPILETSFLLFDGSAVFTDAGENIDAVYILDGACTLEAWPANPCDIVISTVDSADIGGSAFDKSDLAQFAPDGVGGGTATILLDGSDSDVYGSPDSVQTDAAYIRVNPGDATLTIDTYDVSTDDSSAIIGADAGHTPLAGTTFSRDDVVELDQTGDTSARVFRGNIPLGVFLDNGTGTPDPQLRLDALHILEDGYFGHFSISQSQAGNTCEAGKITITKHQGLTHDIDTNYFGSILIETDTGAPNNESWGLDTGLGTLVNLGDGDARYTFVPGDNGQVTLSLSTPDVTTNINVDVSNGIVSELGSEDPNFDFNNVVTVVSFRDEFTISAFNNNDGTAGWSTDWLEGDDDLDPTSGNVQITGGVLSLTSDPITDGNGDDPSIARAADLNDFNRTEDVLLNFDYTYAMVNLGSDVITVEVSNDGVAYSTAIDYNTLSGTNGSPTAESLNLTTLLPGLDYETSLLYVRFRVSSGYTLAAQFFVDNVDLVSGTTDCNIGVIDHYQIIHDGTGISCLGSTITIVGHNATHFPSAPGDGEVMVLGTFQNKGTWASVIAGFGNLADVTVQGVPANTDGAGTYTWFGNENTIQLRFNYTDLSTNPELVNFDLGGTFSEDGATPNHDNDLSISEAGLLFYNETAQAPGIPTQIAGKPSNQYGSEDVIILQAIRTSDDDPSVCEPLFPDTQVVNIDFGAECDDPASCSGGDSFSVNGVGITLNDFNGVPGADTYQSVPVTFTNQTTSTGAVLVLNYSDAGQIELHARYDIPFDNNPENAITSEDFIVGSNSFVVRPFGFDIGFTTDPNAANYRADDANGSAFKTAGTTFATTVTAKAWDPAQPEDDMNQDGIPDDDADLSDNPTTANFGAQGTPEEDDVIITHVLVAPAGGVAGSLTGGNLFTSYNFGVSNEDMSYDEVGIITLTAKLADNNFMGSGEDVQGNVVNVGRFYPHNFDLSMAAAGAVCTPKSDFTYMGQRFTVSFMLEARNEANVRTQNYASTFVKLSDSDFDNDAFFHAVDDIDGLADVDYSSRISSLDGSFFAMFDDVGVGTPGIGSVMGTLVFARENDGLLVEGAEDGPYTVRIGTNFVDSDAVPIALTAISDIDVDDGTNEDTNAIYREISAADVEFRYGRLFIDNAYGPETEALEISLRVEFWDGGAFVLNTDDDCTVISNVALAPALSIVPLSYSAPDFAPDALAIGDTTIGQGLGLTNITLFGGQTSRSEDGDGNDENDSDRPFIASAPIPGVDVPIGSVLVEFDLGSGLLPAVLNFLKYDWRGGAGGSLFDEVPEDLLPATPTGDVYNDNPRALIEFGSYSGHDRVINWQEIYLGL